MLVLAGARREACAVKSGMLTLSCHRHAVHKVPGRTVTKHSAHFNGAHRSLTHSGSPQSDGIPLIPLVPGAERLLCHPVSALHAGVTKQNIFSHLFHVECVHT